LKPIFFIFRDGKSAYVIVILWLSCLTCGAGLRQSLGIEAVPADGRSSCRCNEKDTQVPLLPFAGEAMRRQAKPAFTQRTKGEKRDGNVREEHQIAASAAAGQCRRNFRTSKQIT
jgi:hypothetical protein